MNYQCPTCSSQDTSTYEMAYLSGAHSGYASGTGIDSDGPNAFGGHYNHTSHLAAQTAPPALPIFGCGTLLWLLLGSILLTGFAIAIIGKVFQTFHGLWSFPIFFIAGFILIERNRKSRMPGYHEQMDAWARAMICRRCGHRWLR